MMKFNVFPNMLRFFFLVVVILSQPIAAQEKSSEFTCYVWENLGIEPLWIKSPKGYQSLDLAKNTRSKIYELPAGKPFQIFRKQLVDGKAHYVLSGEAVPPTGSKKFLFILFKNEGKKLPIRIITLDDSLKNFPRGSTKLYNFTSKTLLVNYNGEKSKIPPRELTLVKPNIPKEGGMLPFIIGYQSKIIYETRLFTQRGGRKIIFLYPSRNNDSRRPVEVRFLSQLIAAPQPK